ncbi:MAG: peptidylprolyl isomerase [Acidobacteriota bacterium]
MMFPWRAIVLVPMLGVLTLGAGSGSEPKAKAKKPAAGPNPALVNPSIANEQAPDKFRAKFTTTKGDFVIEVTRDWSPAGADRFYNLVKIGYFKDVAFFRVVENFMAQFGIHGDPRVNAAWRSANITDDPVKQSNLRGFVTFAMSSSPNSRSVQFFINYKDNSFLDGQRFAPFGKVVEGMDVVDSLYKGYGDAPPRGRGPNQALIQSQGNPYLKKDFPELDYIKSASLVNP